MWTSYLTGEAHAAPIFAFCFALLPLFCFPIWSISGLSFCLCFEIPDVPGVFLSCSVQFAGCSYSIMSSAGPSRSSSVPGTPRRSKVKYISAAALNLERVFQQNRARLQQRDGALSPTNEQASANAGKGKPRLLLMGQRRYVGKI